MKLPRNACAVIALLGLASIPCAAQQIANGQFEQGFSNGTAAGWTAFKSSGYAASFADGAEHVRGGAHAQKVTLPNGSNAYAGVWQKIAVPANRLLRIQAWQYKEWSNDPTFILSTIGIDRNGGTTWDYAYLFTAEINVEVGAWHQVSIMVRSDTGLLTVFLRTQFKYAAGGTATVWWDDVSITDAEPAPFSTCAAPIRDGWAYFQQLPYPKDTTIAGNISSHDKTGGNNDGANVPDADDTSRILLDVKGPGAITDLWFTGDMPWEELKFVFDDRPTPEIDLLTLDYFDGQTTRWLDQGQAPWTGRKFPPFTAPLNRGFKDAGEGFVSTILFPFQNHGRLTSVNSLSYYAGSYHKYAPDTVVHTYTTAGCCEDLEFLRSKLADPQDDPKTTTGNQQMSGTANLSPGQSGPLAALTGAGSIAAIHINPSPSTRDVLQNVWLEIRFDGRAPSVFAPLGYFFGCGLGERDVKAVGIGMSTTGEYYCYFPMPFWQGATVRIVNQSASAVTIPFRVIWNSAPYPPDAGYFSATLFHDSFVRFDGAGTYVGCVCTIVASASLGQGYLEGDERVYVDDDRFLTHYGTGTEDFFHGGWFFESGPFSNATHGAPYLAYNVSGQNLHSMYRINLHDYIPFRRGFFLDLEQGPDDGIPADYVMLGFAYRRPVESMEPTDHLTIGDSNSELSHSYVIQGQIWSGSLTARFEGNDDQTNYSYPGRTFSGQSSFRMAIDSQNNGVLLRRLMDQSTDGQEADVYVDGLLVGRWFTLAKNTTLRWHEDSFVIPSSHTVNKSSILIRLQNANPSIPFSEFYYDAFSLYHFNTNDLHFEAEDQPGTTASGAAGVSENVSATGLRWSGDRHLRLAATSAGAYVEWSLNITNAGRYLISCGLTAGNSYGKTRVSIDGTDIGFEIDLGANVPINRRTQMLGIANLPAGPHAVRFRVTGKSGGSIGYNLGVDDFSFNRVGLAGSTPLRIPGDFDQDEDVDQADFGHFQSCLSGPGIDQTDPACQNAKVDSDSDVDQSDFTIFQRCLSGPNVPAELNCVN